MITFWKTLIYLMLQIKLSDTQPFPKDPNSILASTPQYFKTITPLLIADKDLSPLPKETYKIGKEYVNKPDINNKLQEAYKQQVFPALSKPIRIYDGSGITLEDIEFVIQEFDKEVQLQAKDLFNKYEKKYLVSQNKENDKNCF